MNNQGKSKDQLKSTMFGLFIGWVGILFLTLLMLLVGCTTTKKCCDKEHVITEMDGDRVINWYTCKNKGHESKRTN